MKTFFTGFSAVLATGALLMSCSSPKPNSATPTPSATSRELDVQIGGKPAVELSLPKPADTSQPYFVSVDVLPGRGMNIFQIRAFIPGKGVVDVLSAPSLHEAAVLMNGGPDDAYATQSFKMGGAILVPFANRIRGKLSADEKTLQTTILGKTVTLDANWIGKLPTAEYHAMHGLIMGRAMDSVNTHVDAGQASVIGLLDAGDFGGHWLSKTQLTITATLQRDSVVLQVAAKNVGDADDPIGVGWHPYFELPSGDRTQARLRIPAKQRALVNNYDDVFPTGKLVPVAGTPYDFSGPTGAPLGKLFMDDCFVDLQRDPDGGATAEIIDPAAHYGLRIQGQSKEITAFQAYAPPDKNFVAFEPQFNWADPYSKIWHGKETGMVVLKPGQSVTYEVALRLFVP
jgi:aldose 1-epimerase